MASMGVATISLPGIAADASRPLPWRDPVLKGVANSGVRFLFDLAFPFSYPGGALVGRPAAGNPANGQVICDVTELGNGAFSNIGSGTTYAGGGFDFTNSQGTAAGLPNVQAPASALADIAAAYGGKAQRYLIAMWAKLPSLANWNSAAQLLAIAGDRPFTANPSLATFGMNNTPAGSLRTYRQTAANTAESTLLITPAAADYGSIVQIGLWRNDAGQGFRLRSPNGTVLSTAAIGVDNTQDFSVNPFAFGRAQTFTGPGTGVITALSGFRTYRGFIENLARSGRDPAAVLDVDYAAVIGRAVYS